MEIEAIYRENKGDVGKRVIILQFLMDTSDNNGIPTVIFYESNGIIQEDWLYEDDFDDKFTVIRKA